MHTLPPVAEVRHDETQDVSQAGNRDCRISVLKTDIASLEEHILAEETLLHPKNSKYALPSNSYQIIEQTERANKDKLQALKAELNKLQSQEGAGRHVVEIQDEVTSSVTGLL